MATDYIDYNFSLTVPLPFVYLSISDDNLRESVILERNARRQGASRSLNAMGMYAYRSTIAAYLSINYIDVDREIIKKVEDIMSAPMPAASISIRLGLGMTDEIYVPGCQGLEELVEVEQRVFYAYMNAIYQERTNLELQQFIGPIFEANKEKIVELIEKSVELEPIAEQPHKEGFLFSFGEIGMDSIPVMGHTVVVPRAQTSPRKRKYVSGAQNVDTSTNYVSKRRRV
ncbi:hypothetical protein TWF694_004762 [Orbilia ellipsospora]|uniref:Uncharacterized protein n=1 Tax=Orbilia ellipsospora TaxID=2528407 RepID=A0AAV9WXH5_9PEZI